MILELENGEGGKCAKCEGDLVGGDMVNMPDRGPAFDVQGKVIRIRPMIAPMYHLTCEPNS